MQAKPLVINCWVSYLTYLPHGEWIDSVCFERGARMDLFAAVLTTLSCSSMYKVICLKKRTLCLTSDNYHDLWVHVKLILSFLRRLKMNHKTRLGICVCSWDQHHPEHWECVQYTYTYIFCFLFQARAAEDLTISLLHQSVMLLYRRGGNIVYHFYINIRSIYI